MTDIIIYIGLVSPWLLILIYSIKRIKEVVEE